MSCVCTVRLFCFSLTWFVFQGKAGQPGLEGERGPQVRKQRASPTPQGPGGTRGGVTEGGDPEDLISYPRVLHPLTSNPCFVFFFSIQGSRGERGQPGSTGQPGPKVWGRWVLKHSRQALCPGSPSLHQPLPGECVLQPESHSLCPRVM